MSEEEETGFQPFRGIRNRLAARKEEAEKRRLAKLLSATKAEPLHDFRSPLEKASQHASDAAQALEQAIAECEAAINDRNAEKAAELSAEIYVLAEKSYTLAQKAVDIATFEAQKKEKDRLLQKHNSADEDELEDEEEEEEEEGEEEKSGGGGRPSSPRNNGSSPKVAYKKGTSVKERIDADEATRRRMELKIRTRKLLEKRKSNKSENFDKDPPSSPIYSMKKTNDKKIEEDEDDPFIPIGDID
jgi:hypothetical protein